MRRALLAKDSLASVDGLRIMVLLAYEHLFGMRVCPNCPHCNHDEAVSPCQDLFGSNAKAEGGVFGRIDAGYTSFEAQKSTGALHAHSQLFVQCLHQHKPLSEVLQSLAGFWHRRSLTPKVQIAVNPGLVHGMDRYLRDKVV